MKYWNYVILSVGLALIFQMAGFNIGGPILEYVGVTTAEGSTIPTGFDLRNSTFYTYFFSSLTGILALAIGSALVIGFFTKSNTENYVILPFIIGGALAFFTIWLSIVSYAYTNFIGQLWIAHSILVIAVILSVGFVIASYEHFRASD